MTNNQKERPIVYSGPMVRAILERRKTQTRRIIKLIDFGTSDTKGYDWHFRNRRLLWNDVSTKLLIDRFCPYGKPGDVLWVKETFAIDKTLDCFHVDGITYKSGSYYENDKSVKWTPSIYMPRWASRIDTLIKNIWAERLQNITEEDAIAEGIEKHLWDKNDWVWVIEFELLNNTKYL